ncbi:MAG: radical SAM protein [Deltaproteobacteria bacterium]|nr:MAG: radical SAM protein [Deltaproteobacteria bacterium]
MGKIIFINSPVSLVERYGKLAQGGTNTPPLGLANLAAVTQNQGYQTEIIDPLPYRLSQQEIVESIREKHPQWVGFTATAVSIHRAAELAKLIKRSDPKIITIIGGAQLSALPEEMMNEFCDFDIGLVGEGEKTIVDLLSCLQEGRNLKEINGLVIRGNGEPTLTKDREYIKDLDQLPLPAWDLLPDIRKHYQPAAFNCRRFPASSILTSRGCPGKCTFCDLSVFKNSCRSFSAEYVIEMIRILWDSYGIREISIHDDNFLMFKQRLVKICELLITEGWRLSWSCNGRVDQMDQDILQLIRKAGCWQVGYGIESGSEAILEQIKKGINLEQITRVVRWTREAGIRVRGYFMLGNPGETRETMIETIEFAKKLGVDDFQLTYFTPFPGSESFRNADNYGTFTKDYRIMTTWFPVFIPKALSRETLESYYRKAFREFYMRPKVIWSYLRMVQSPRHLLHLFRGFLSLLRLILNFSTT